MTKFYVVDENTLVHSFPPFKDIWQVMARKVNSSHNLWDTIARNESDMRPATKTDFDFFRVSWKGHLPD